MKNINVLDVEVSYFKNCTDVSNPTTVNLLTFLRSEKHRAAVEQVRAVEGKAERDALKKALLPGITPSGVFTHRAENGLVKHSGLIAGDVDMKDNPYTPHSLKAYISGFVNVAYCGFSASGRGVWFLIPIAQPDRHKEHFAALREQFAKDGIRLDPAPANVASFRFYSFDPDAHFNPNAATYSKLIADRPATYHPPASPPRPSPPRRRIESDNAAKVETILQQIETNRTDITDGYDTWFSIGCALANEFGESGRDYFHRAGQFHPEYSNRDTDRQFSYCLRMKSNRYTLGTLFEIARRYGIEYKGHLPRSAEKAAHAAPQSPTAPKPAPSALPPGYRRERYTDRETGQPFEILLNANGYPAAWDLPDEQRESLARMIRQNPAVTELIARFDLKLESINAL